MSAMAQNSTLNRQLAQQPTPTPEPAPPDVQWSCQTSLMNERGEPSGDLSGTLTVGQKLHLACEGSEVSFAESPGSPTTAPGLIFELPKEQKYVLRLLETQSLSPTRGEFVITSWVAGNHTLKNPILTDGKVRIGLGEIQLPVQSVIKPEENPEGQPYGPWSAMALSWPPYIWIVIALLFALAATVLLLAVRKSVRRKRLLQELEKNATALSPYNQFNKDLRRLSRQFPVVVGRSWSPEDSAQYLQELNQSFRWYLARELIVPAFEFSPSAIVNEVKRIDKKLHKNVHRDLRLALEELNKALNSKKPLLAEDAMQLTELCRKLADRIMQARS